MKYLVTTFIVFVAVAQGLATHIRGGEITVKRINNLTYEITLKGYANTRSLVKFSADGGGSLDFGDGSPLCHPLEIDDYLPTADPSVGIALYKVTHTYPAVGFYKVSYYESNLDEGIINVDDSVDTPFYIESGILVDPSLKPSSIVFACDPFFSLPDWGKAILVKRHIRYIV